MGTCDKVEREKEIAREKELDKVDVSLVVVSICGQFFATFSLIMQFMSARAAGASRLSSMGKGEFRMLVATLIGISMVLFALEVGKLYPPYITGAPNGYINCDSSTCQSITHVCVMTIIGSIPLGGDMTYRWWAGLELPEGHCLTSPASAGKVIQFLSDLILVLFEFGRNYRSTSFGTRVLVAFTGILEIAVALADFRITHFPKSFDVDGKMAPEEGSAEHKIWLEKKREEAFLSWKEDQGRFCLPCMKLRKSDEDTREQRDATGPVTPPSPLPPFAPPPAPATSGLGGGQQDRTISMTPAPAAAPNVSSMLTFGEWRRVAGDQSSNGGFEGAGFRV